MIEPTNHFENLKTLSYGRDSFIECVETVDVDKLNFIINNKDIFEPLLREERKYKNDDFTYDPFLMAKNYLDKSRQGKVNVVYKQKKSVGRKYAMGSLSLQCLTRQIRQAICGGYIDIDIKNCHPTILKFICDECGISCPVLTKYVENREGFFKDNGVTKDVGKIVFLSVMNGGFEDYLKLENPSADFKEFYETEIKNIHQNLCIRHAALYTKHITARESMSPPKIFNHAASFMNIILCDIEDKILSVMWEFWGSPKSAVMCFDGIMLECGEYNLSGAENAIFDALHINIDLVLKPFTDAFDLTPYDPSAYVETSLGYYPDFRHLVNKDIDLQLLEEWCVNSITLIENGGKSFFLTKNNAVDNTETRIYHKQVKEEDLLKSLKVRSAVINPKFDYAFWLAVMTMKPKERKELMADMSPRDKLRLQKYLYEWIGAYITAMMENRTLKTFNNIEFYPFLARNGEPKLYDSFNTFTGFPLELVPLKVIKPFTESRIYKHIHEEMMNGCVDEFNHFLDHIADMIQDPANIKTNAHLFYTSQGMGKGMLARFVSRLLGTDHTINFENTDAYFGKFNADQSNKLLKVFEEVSDKGAAFANHDRLKGDQSKTTERIEPKGIDPYSLRHCARFWYFTNNENALFIEGNDRRFTCHKANNRYANNIPYFAPMWAEVEDEQFCKNAFEFFATRAYDRRNAFVCFNNTFKREQKELNLSNGLKFLKEIAESKFDGIEVDNNKIRARDLADTYRDWCVNGGVKFHLGSFKTQLKKMEIVSKAARFDGVVTKCYTLDAEILLGNFRTFLNDDTFEFDTE